VLPGIALGLLAAGGSRLVDHLIGTVLNALLAIPGLLLALVVVTLLGAGPLPIALGVGFALIAQYARLTRAALLAARAMPYVDAARALGASEWTVSVRHVLPNAAPTLLAFAGVTFGYSILNSAALSFLGLSGDLGAPDWGAMLYDARVTFRVAPWVSIAPGAAISLLVFAANRLAETRASDPV
jgi:peptide/nickel transport system permease protein